MATGGRVLHHLPRRCQPEEHGAVRRLPGGRHPRPALVDGVKQMRIKGRDIPVAAHIEKIDSMSAHADADEILRWLSGFSAPPR